MSWKVPALLGCLAAAALVIAVMQWTGRARLQSENADLRSMAEAAPADVPAAVAQEADSEKISAAAERRELLQLRNQVRELRETTKELEKLRKELAAAQAEYDRLRMAHASNGLTNAAGFFAKETWHFAGYATPEAALHSWIYATASGDWANSVASLTPEQQAYFKEQYKSKPDQFTSEAKKGAGGLVAYQILARESVSDDEVILGVNYQGADGNSRTRPIRFKRIGNEWRLANYYRRVN